MEMTGSVIEPEPQISLSDTHSPSDSPALYLNATAPGGGEATLVILDY